MKKKILILSVVTSAVFSALPFAALADGKNTVIDKAIGEVMVYGTRLPVALFEVGTSISVITAQDIELKGYDFAVDALADVNGVTVNQNGSFGGAAFVRTRGASSNGHTLVLIDGVAVNDPTSVGNAFDFATLDAQNIERIEVLKGGQATLWGSDAMAGVVSITMKQPDENELTAFVETGSYKTLRTGIALGGAAGKATGRLSVNYQQTDGISKADEDDGNNEKDGFESTTITAKGNLAIHDDLTITGSLIYAKSETEFDAFGPIDGEGIADNNQLIASVTGRFSSSETAEHSLQLGYTKVERDNYGADIFAFSEQGKRTQLRYQSIVTLSENTRTTFGADYEETVLSEIGADDKADIASLFGVYEMSPRNDLTLTAGLRYDNHSLFGDEVTGRASLAYKISEQVYFYSTVSQGRKAPTLDELNDTATLQPEEATSIDLGVGYNTDNGLKVNLTYFIQDTENLIQYIYANCQGRFPNTSNCYANINEAEAAGVELSTELELNDSYALAVNYTYTNAETGDGKQLGRIPEHEANLTLSYQPDGALSGNLIARYNGEELDRNGSATTLDSWVRFDANGVYDLGAGKQIYGRIENIFDEDYQQVFGYGTAGLSVYLGVRLKM